MGSGEVSLGMRPHNIDEIISAKGEATALDNRDSVLTSNTKGMRTKTQSKVDIHLEKS